MSRPIRLFLTYATLTLWAGICLFPLYWMVTLSLKAPPDIVSGPRYLPFIDFRPSLESWTYILFNPEDDTLKRYANSVLIAFGATGLTVLLGALATYGLTRLKGSVSLRMLLIAGTAVTLAGLNTLVGFRAWLGIATAAALFVALAGRMRGARRVVPGGHMLLALVLTRILPPVAILLPVYFMVQGVGLLDTRSAVILVYTAVNLPVAIWLLRGFLQEIPTEIEDAAEVDGASRWRIFFTLIVPLAKRGLVATGLLIFILCWNEYLFAAYLTTDHALTMPPFLAGQMATREQMASAQPEWGYFSVLIVLMVAPIVFCMGLLQRVVSRSFGG